MKLLTNKLFGGSCIFAALFMSLTMVGCGGSTVPVKTPAPVSNSQQNNLSSIVLGLDAFQLACQEAATVTNPTITKWLETCPQIVTTATAAIQSGDPTKTAQIVVSGLQTLIATQPIITSSIPPDDVKYINAALVAINEFITVYQQYQSGLLTGTPNTTPAPAKVNGPYVDEDNFMDSNSSLESKILQLTKADKKKLKEIQKKWNKKIKELNKKKK